MGFLKNVIRNAVNDGISKGIRDAVSSAAEKIVAPKAEAYANAVADSLDEAAQAVNSASAPAEKKTASSLEESLSRLEKAAESYAKAVEENTAGLREWSEKLDGFPVWCFGGKNFSIEENYTSDEGVTYYLFNADGATCDDLAAYVNLLKADGFVQKYKGEDSVLYKDLGGEYLVFSAVEAFNDVDRMSVGMHRTKNENDM